MSFKSHLDQMYKTHSVKTHDYTDGAKEDNLQNFERAATVAAWFARTQDKGFAYIVTIKLARLASLVGRKTPKNESINDTYLDLLNYVNLWWCNYEQEQEPLNLCGSDPFAQPMSESPIPSMIPVPANYDPNKQPQIVGTPKESIQYWSNEELVSELERRVKLRESKR